MDGNGRWAAARGLPRILGHRAGVEAARRVVEAAPGAGVAILTLFAFSSDNWRRPPEEVDALMGLMAAYLENETPRCVQKVKNCSTRPSARSLSRLANAPVS